MLNEPIFTAHYAPGAQENFKRALAEGKYETAHAILIHIPKGQTSRETEQRRILLVEGLNALVYELLEGSSAEFERLKKECDEYRARVKILENSPDTLNL